MDACKGFKEIFTTYTYVLLVLAMSLYYFMTTAIQFWMTDYMIEVLKQE